MDSMTEAMQFLSQRADRQPTLYAAGYDSHEGHYAIRHDHFEGPIYWLGCT